MRKLKLNVGALQVESFAASQPSAEGGTVHGQVGLAGFRLIDDSEVANTASACPCDPSSPTDDPEASPPD